MAMAWVKKTRLHWVSNNNNNESLYSRFETNIKTYNVHFENRTIMIKASITIYLE